MRTTDTMRRAALIAALAVASTAAAGSPAPEVGSAAPELELVSAAGDRLSLAANDGPTVLIFYRGLW